MPGTDAPWSALLGSTYAYKGPASELHTNEHLSLRLHIQVDGAFTYETRLFDGGQAYTLESMKGVLQSPAEERAEHDFVLEVTSTAWQSGSWNGEDR